MKGFTVALLSSLLLTSEALARPGVHVLAPRNKAESSTALATTATATTSLIPASTVVNAASATSISSLTDCSDLSTTSPDGVNVAVGRANGGGGGQGGQGGAGGQGGQGGGKADAGGAGGNAAANAGGNAGGKGNANAGGNANANGGGNGAAAAAAASSSSVAAAAAASSSAAAVAASSSSAAAGAARAAGTTAAAANGKGKGNNKGGGAAAAAAASSSAAAAGTASAAAASNSALPVNENGKAGPAVPVLQSNAGTTLDSKIIQSTATNANATAGQAASATSDDNFINFCSGKTITNGLQVKTGSCNPITMGDIPSTQNMVTTMFTSPTNGATVKAGQTFTVGLMSKGITLGSFTDAAANYYAAPQQLDSSGQIVGHAHVVIQQMTSADSTALLDPNTFNFFKGLDNADVNGLSTVDVEGGLEAGAYRLCTIMSASNHQSVVMPIAQRGAENTCSYFTAA